VVLANALSVLESGRYRTDSNTINCPPNVTEPTGYLWVDVWNDPNAIYMEWQDYNETQRWARRKSGGVWGAWYNTLYAVQQVPYGTVADFAGTTAPSGWLFCYGQSLVRATYPLLFAAIGATYGAADSTHFNLPDCRGRVVAGKDNMGGTSANRLLGANAQSVNGDILGDTGGQELHAVTIAEMPFHTHVAQAAGAHQHTIDVGNGIPGSLSRPAFTAQSANTLYGTTVAGNHSHALEGTGSDDPHNNVQPTIIMNKIIRVDD
jgi:microcystin-dependent protein